MDNDKAGFLKYLPCSCSCSSPPLSLLYNQIYLDSFISRRKDFGKVYNLCQYIQLFSKFAKLYNLSLRRSRFLQLSSIRLLSLGFFSIGCWRDQPERALPSLEGIFPILDGNDYMHRKYAIRKCAQVARVQGFFAFAIENGGHCLGGKNILQTYSMYGASRACKQDGKGGPWSMEVYKFTSKLFFFSLIHLCTEFCI